MPLPLSHSLHSSRIPLYPSLPLTPLPSPREREAVSGLGPTPNLLRAWTDDHVRHTPLNILYRCRLIPSEEDGSDIGDIDHKLLKGGRWELEGER